jgi:hypothetical protein
LTGASGGVAGPVGGPGGTPYSKEFVRTTADGITIRAYATSASGRPLFPPGTPGCPSFDPGLQVEVSTAAVAQQVFTVLVPEGGALKAYSLSTAGVAEGAPLWVVQVETDSTVAEVKVSFGAGETDQMKPVNGWAVLAHTVPASARSTSSVGGVQVINAQGKVVAGAQFQLPSTGIDQPVVVPSPASPGVGSVAPNQGSSSSGVASASSSGSGSAVASATTVPAVPAVPPDVSVTTLPGSGAATPPTTLTPAPTPCLVPPEAATTPTTK